MGRLPVNLKYVTAAQLLDVTFEGQSRRFAISSVSAFKDAQANEIEDVAADLSRMNLANSKKLWTVGWDTIITVIDENNDLPDPKKVKDLKMCGI